MNKKIKKIIALATFTTAGISCLNRIINYTATLKQLMTSDQGNFYKWKNGSIFYTVHGTGSPLLLIHDLHPSSSMVEWTKTIKKLEKNHTVYCIDLLGCGRSDKPVITYTNYLYVQLIHDFITDIIGEKASVAATGTSASFAIMCKIMNPESFDQLIVINPESPTKSSSLPDRYKLWYKHLLDCPIFGTFFYNIEMHEKNISRQFSTLYYSKPSLVSKKIKDMYFESAHLGMGSGRHLLSSIRADYTNIGIAHALPKLDKLSIISSRELPVQTSISDAYTRLNKNIDTAYISHAKYLPQLEVPDKLSEMIEMFLNNQ